MVFRRQRDEVSGFRRMREALQQPADPRDHALLDDYEPVAVDALPAAVIDDRLVPPPPVEVPARSVPVERHSAPAPANRSLPAADAAAPPAAAAEGSGNGPALTTIGADTAWNGTLRCQSNLFVEGQVEGEVEARETIFVAERARVQAKLTARALVVAGEVQGEIDCLEKLEVMPTGRIVAGVCAGSLVVHEGALIDGKVTMRAGGR